LRLPCFTIFSLTKEDRQRADQYAARARSKQSETLFSSPEEYRRSLEMQMGIDALNEGNRQRILQLIAKTNQFNTTTRRHTQQAIAQMQTAGAEVFAISLADRFSAREIIGVLILQPRDKQSLEIESFILSCRVLGRGLETGVLAWAGDHARRLGYSRLFGDFIPTDRNQPAADLYPSHGFTPLSAGSFALDLEASRLAMPDWFEVLQ